MLEDTPISSGREYVLRCGRKVLGDKFFLDEQLIKNYKKIYDYLFCNDDNYLRSNKIYKNRGVWIGGNPGNGKSVALKVMNEMIIQSYLDPINRFRTIPYLDFEKQYRKAPEDVFDLYGKTSMKTIGIDEVLYKDDKTRADYQTPIILIQEFIHNRCELFSEEGIVTHFTSNFFLESALSKEKLDLRSEDRIKEMFYSIQWEGDSYRGRLENIGGGIHG